eukprot:TRINITY_DN2349_c0_g1_i5.p1 TRINITY_DN2349_c0_g1~~TRINITY_DN2349_c0_g1_i5.p1  ORF type:complete len:551 (+),score=131.35 TRINITY_DN2349_c0_g1_i5:64-1653(+)
MHALAKENDQLKRRIKILEGQLALRGATAPVLLEVTATENETHDDSQKILTVVVMGASGDLAKKKTFPALFELHCRGLLPHNFLIVGYARTQMTDEKFHEFATQNFKNKEKIPEFVKKLFYFSGQYNEASDLDKLNHKIHEWEKHLLPQSKGSNRIYYMALPPVVFTDAARAIKAKGLSTNGWNRVIIEKPFGMDLESSRKMQKELGATFTEDQVYRIDHYLGKEMVQNLMVLRFANSVFEPLWNNKYISNVTITFKENFGTEGRGGYFDQFGIIRDVMQNHLTQILSLVAMEPPVSLGAEDIRDEKVKVLRSIPPVDPSQVVVGQYDKDEAGKQPSYLEDKTVPPGSLCPTFAAAVLNINNTRWSGVPFILKCGKALNERKAEIRVQFKEAPGQLFSTSRNELVCLLQPKEAVYLKTMIKVPGLSSELVQGELDLSYDSRFKEAAKGLPDAYERLILDVIRGDHNLFVRNDELDAAWKIFTPLLHHLANEKVKPILYPFGSRGPKEADELAANNGFKRTTGYKWGNKI